MDYKKIIGLIHKYDVFRRLCIKKEACDVALHKGQFPILMTIMQNEGCTQVEIADKLHVTPASIACSTKRLQNSGLIEKKTDESDLRRNIVTVTEKGKCVAERFHIVLEAIDKRTFDGFSDDELDTLYGMVTRMAHNVAGENLDKGMYELMQELEGKDR